MPTVKVKVESRNWKRIPTPGPVLSMEADQRLDIDIDPRGCAWARIARGYDNSVEVCVEYSKKVGWEYSS